MQEDIEKGLILWERNWRNGYEEQGKCFAGKFFLSQESGVFIKRFYFDWGDVYLKFSNTWEQMNIWSWHNICLASNIIEYGIKIFLCSINDLGMLKYHWGVPYYMHIWWPIFNGYMPWMLMDLCIKCWFLSQNDYKQSYCILCIRFIYFCNASIHLTCYGLLNGSWPQCLLYGFFWINFIYEEYVILMLTIIAY